MVGLVNNIDIALNSDALRSPIFIFHSVLFSAKSLGRRVGVRICGSGLRWGCLGRCIPREGSALVSCHILLLVFLGVF